MSMCDFRDVYDKIYIDYFEKEKFINNGYYIKFLVTLNEEITEKTTANEKEKKLLYQENAPCHNSL